MSISAGTPEYTIIQAAEVAGIPPNTIRSWVQRGHVQFDLEFDKPAEAAGHAHVLSLRRVYQLALAAEMMTLGVEAPRALSAAMRFSDLGKGGAEYSPARPKSSAGLDNFSSRGRRS